MTEREKLLQQVRMYHFALIEVGLFLDSHPKNAAALAYFQQNKQKYNDAVAAFEAKFGPAHHPAGNCGQRMALGLRPVALGRSG